MPDAIVSAAPRPGAGPAENLLKELQQGRKMQMIEALQVKLLEDQRRSLRHFELVQDGLSRMRAGVVLSGRPHTTAGAYAHASDVDKRAEDMRRMSFSEILRQEVETARIVCAQAPAPKSKASESQRCEEEDEAAPVPPRPGGGPVVSIAVSETETKPSPPSPGPGPSRTETGGQSQSLSLKPFKSMKTAGTVKFRHQGSQEEGQNVETLSSFTDVSPVNRASELDDLLGFTYHHVEKTERGPDPSDPLRRVPVVCHSGTAERLSHKGRVVDFAFSSDGRLAAADEGNVACWQAVPPAMLWEAATSSVSRFAASPSGKHVAAANLRGRIYVWDTNSSKSATREMPEEVMVLRFIADDKLAVALAESVRLFAIPEFQEVVELVQPGVSALCASPDTTVLVAVGGAADPALPADAPEAEGCVIWDVSVFGRIGSIVFADKVHALAYQPDGARLATAGDGKLISVFEMENFDHAFDLPCASSVKALAWSPSLRCLASGGDDGTIRVWDLVRKQSLFQLSECKECISSLSWSSRGVLAFGHPKSKEICLALLEELPSQSSEAVEVSPAAVSEATESAPSFVLSVQMVSSASGRGASPPPETAAASPDGERGEGFVVQIQRDRVDADSTSLNLGQRTQGLQLAHAATSMMQDNGDLSACIFMPHDQSIMVAGRSVVELQVQQRHRLREIGLPKPATVLAVSPCGGFVAAASENTVMVYRLTTAREEPILSRKVECNVSKLALSAMNFLAVGLGDKVLVCHLSDNKDPRQLVMTGQVHGLAFSPAGDVLAVAAGGDDARSRASMWIVARDQCHYLGAAVSKQARAVAFSSSGKILAVGCDDGKIPLLLPEQEFKCWTELRLASDPTCRNLEWAGSFLAAAGTSQVSVFNASSGQMVLQIPSYEDTILSISLSTSGSTLACCFRSHVALYPLEECEAEVTHGKHAIQVPSDKEKVKSRGTTANLGEVLGSSGSLTHSIKLTYPGEVSTDDSELRAHTVRKLNSVGSCGKLNKSQTTESGMDEETGEAGPDAAHDTGELFVPGLAVLKPRISVTDLSQDGQSGRNTPEEEDAEAAQFRKRALLARDLGLDMSLLCKVTTVPRTEGIPIKLAHADEVCSLSFSSCSTRLVAGGYDQHLVMWDAESMARTAEHHVEAEILCVAISPCGKYVYCGDNDREVNVFDAGTLEVLGKQVLKEQFVSLVGISSPTSLLAVASHIVVKIFSVPDVEEVTSLQHGGQVHSLSYSPTLGMLAAAGGIDITESGLLSYNSSSFREKDPGGMKAVVWKGSSEFAAIWDEVGTVSYKDPCHAASFSPSGKALALGGEDRIISLLSVEKKFRQVEQLPCGAGIRCLAWAANSRLLASAGEDMRVSVWDVLYKRVILQLPKADDWLCSLAFSANSKWLAACGYGQNTVDLWPLEVELIDPSSNE